MSNTITVRRVVRTNPDGTTRQAVLEVIETPEGPRLHSLQLDQQTSADALDAYVTAIHAACFTQEPVNGDGMAFV